MRNRVHHRAVVEDALATSSSTAELEELAAALRETPRRIPSRWFYDRAGSELFERITRLDEYYLTRAEGRLLERSADDIVAQAGAQELVELGAGSARKTRWLLDAMDRAGLLGTYVPVDVSASEVRRVAQELVEEYPGLIVHGMVADFTRHLGKIPEGGRRLVILLGSTIGNFRPERARRLLSRVRESMAEGDAFLLGVDLVKSAEALVAAYDDPQGLTAAFNRNILVHVNRVVEGDFDPEAFEHRAVWNPEDRWIEMRLRSRRPQRVTLDALDLAFSLSEGEEILTEISAKYDLPAVESMLADAGFVLERWWTEDALFGLALARCANDAC